MNSDAQSDMNPLRSMTYPGRFILIGRDSAGKNNIIVYGVTGRSPSSQARKIIREGDGIWVRPTSACLVRKGRPELLIYPALLSGPHGVAVSNGRQTEAVLEAMKTESGAIRGLAHALAEWEYEPDEPTFTPRISGSMLRDGTAGLAILKRGNNKVCLRQFFEFPLLPGKGYLMATYYGENRDPLPVFRGEPMEMDLSFTTARDTAFSVYEALAPSQAGDGDYRVGVVCAYVPVSFAKSWDVQIINRSERKAN